MAKKFGNLLFSRNSWGRNELFAAFGFNGASKATLNQTDSAKELLSTMKEQQGWVYLGDALGEFLSMAENMSPTDSYKIVYGNLMVLWNKYNALMRDTTPNECHLLQAIISSVVKDFDNVATVGRNKLRDSILLHSLNVFETI